MAECLLVGSLNHKARTAAGEVEHHVIITHTSLIRSAWEKDLGSGTRKPAAGGHTRTR